MFKSILTGATNGVLGINRRNLNYVYPGLKRSVFKIADQKLLSKELFAKCSAQYPQTLATFVKFGDLMELNERMKGLEKFVIKPNRGRQGSGILVVGEAREEGWANVSGKTISRGYVKKHIADILMGVYSKGVPDTAVVETRIYPHEFFAKIYPIGLPDIRLIVYRKKPIMSMLRVPTRESEGKANLHQGGIGIGVDIRTGITGDAIVGGFPIECHPDSKVPLKGLTIPYFSDILKSAVNIAHHVPLHYIGFDFTIDDEHGPMLLEMNARPGLEIQKANRQGLREVLENV